MTGKPPHRPEGRLVLQAARRHVWVAAEDGEGGPERLRVLGGVDLVPGDLARVDPRGAVRERAERRSCLRRRTFRGEQVLAANLDDLLVITAAGTLEGGEGLIARCIAAARGEGIEPVLVFNKADLDATGELSREAGRFAALGLSTFVTSARTGEGLRALAERIAGRMVALVGASGVGKSTIINALVPDAAQQTADVGERGRGRHTTTLGRGIPWGGGLLVDLPGVRSFGLFDDTSLDAAYPDVAAAARDCYFADCAHDTEPDCAVKAAVSQGALDPARLESWRRVRQSILAGQEGAGRGGRPRPA